MHNVSNAAYPSEFRLNICSGMRKRMREVVDGCQDDTNEIGRWREMASDAWGTHTSLICYMKSLSMEFFLQFRISYKQKGVIEIRVRPTTEISTQAFSLKIVCQAPPQSFPLSRELPTISKWSSASRDRAIQKPPYRQDLLVYII
jgi:hypothetical protein